jgi:hypothetical protein
MKYLKKLNLIKTTTPNDLKKTIDTSYHKGTTYYKKIENSQHKQPPSFHN